MFSLINNILDKLSNIIRLCRYVTLILKNDDSCFVKFVSLIFILHLRYLRKNLKEDIYHYNDPHIKQITIALNHFDRYLNHKTRVLKNWKFRFKNHQIETTLKNKTNIFPKQQLANVYNVENYHYKRFWEIIKKHSQSWYI